MRKNIEDKINRIQDFMKEFISANGYPPSYREISKHCQIKSTNSVKQYIDTMEELGIIHKDPTKNRAIGFIEDEIVASSAPVRNIPLIGRITAGVPILAEQNYEDTYKISSSLFGNKEDVFMLKVVGDSMIDAGIYDKDMIFVKRQSVAENGEIVVALIDNEATVKEFYKEDGHIRLQPKNENYLPIIIPSVKILGKVIGLIRTF